MRRMFSLLTLVSLVILAISSSYAETICKLEKTVSLFRPPKEWGKAIPKSEGQLTYCKEPGREFRGRVILKGLEPKHNYKLSLNDKKAPAEGHGKLPESYNDESKYDFQDIPTDGKGESERQFSTEDERLPDGKYDVKFFVKDWDSDGKPIVLYNNDIYFSIKK